MNCFHGGEIFQTRGQKSRTELDISSHRRREFFVLALILALILLLILVLARVFVIVQRARDKAGLSGCVLTMQHENRQPARHCKNCHTYGLNTTPVVPETFGRWL